MALIIIVVHIVFSCGQYMFTLLLLVDTIKFQWLVEVGWFAQSFLCQHTTKVEDNVILWFSWGCDNLVVLIQYESSQSKPLHLPYCITQKYDIALSKCCKFLIGFFVF